MHLLVSEQYIDSIMHGATIQVMTFTSLFSGKFSDQYWHKCWSEMFSHNSGRNYKKAVKSYFRRNEKRKGLHTVKVVAHVLC